MPTDYYELLGVAPGATEDEIKRAYRALARRLHPDANGGDAGSEARFKEVSVAYETLRDPERRRRYDMFGPDAGPGGSGGAGGAEVFDIGDLFDAVFGGAGPFAGRRGPAGPARGQDAEARVDLDLSEAAFGVTRTVELTLPGECDTCAGSGCAPGTHAQTCTTCGGAGQVRQARNSLLGQLVTVVPCRACGGTGSLIPNPCPTCRGDGRVRAHSSIEVEIPAGIDGGRRLRLTGRGAAAPRGGAPGDLYVTVHVRAHPTLERVGSDLHLTQRIALSQAVLGTTLAFDTLDGPCEVEVAPGTQPGHVSRVKGRGVPVLQGRGRGDLYVTVEVEVPTKLDAEQAELIAHFAELRGEAVAQPGEPGLLSRLRSALK